MIDPRNPSSTGREPIYAAAFALFQFIPGLAVASRIWRAPDELNDSQFPALFFEEQPEEKEAKVEGQLYHYTLKIDLTLYVQANQSDVAVGQETVFPASELNNLIDAVELAFSVPRGQRQTLGGLVSHAEIKGRIEKLSGIPGRTNQVSMAVIPIIITTL